MQNTDLIRRATDIFDWDEAFVKANVNEKVFILNSTILNTNVNEKVFILNSTILNVLSNFIQHETVDNKDLHWFTNKIKKSHPTGKQCLQKL